LDEKLALAEVRDLGGNPDEVPALPLGSFTALNRLVLFHFQVETNAPKPSM